MYVSVHPHIRLPTCMVSRHVRTNWSVIVDVIIIDESERGRVS